MSPFEQIVSAPNIGGWRFCVIESVTCSCLFKDNSCRRLEGDRAVFFILLGV